MTTNSELVPNFLGGVSQQPDSQRLPNQAQVAENVYFSLVDGAGKRWPTTFIEQINAGTLSDRRVESMDRDDAQYVAVLGQGSVQVFDTDGVSYDVLDTTAGSPYTASFTYLTNAGRTDIRAQTIVDTMFVLNRNTTVLGAQGVTRESWDTAKKNAGVFVRQSNYGVKYTIKIKTTSMGSAWTTTVSTPHAIAAGATSLVAVAPTAGGAGTIWDLSGTLTFNSLEELTFSNKSGAGGSIAKSDWEMGPGEDQLRYVGSNAWTGGANTMDVDRIAITTNSKLQTNRIAQKLREQITASSGIPGLAIEGEDEDSSFLIKSSDTIDTFEVTDSVGNTYMTGWTNEVENITDLPKVFKHGAVVRINGDTVDRTDDYYVRFATEEWARDTDNDFDSFSSYSGFGQGTWEETAWFEASTGSFDSSTMPHVLIRSIADAAIAAATSLNVGDIFFDWHPYGSWDQRSAGDDESNAEPTFVDKKIRDIFFWQGRLGFLADSNVILSQSGNVGNFWRTTVLSVPDSDPIDVASTEDQGATLNHAVPLDERLYMFSANSQVVLTSSTGIITPQTVEAPVASRFDNLANTKPALVGRTVFMPYCTSNYIGLREIIPLQEQDAVADLDVTAPIQEYITKGEGRVLGVSTDEMVFFHTDQDPDKLFVYKYVRIGSDLAVAAWNTWTFSGDIVDFTFVRDVLYLVVEHNGTTDLEKIEVGPGQTDPSSAISVRLDRKLSSADASISAYDPATDTTAFVLPYKLDSADEIQVVTRAGGAEDPGGILQIDSVVVGTSTVTVQGDQTGVPLWFGVPYTFQWKASRPYVRINTGRGVAPSSNGSTTVRGLAISLDDTGYVEAEVSYRAGDTFTIPYTGNPLGSIGAGLEDDFDNTDPTRDALFYVDISAEQDDFRVRLLNSTPLPSNITGAEWDVRHRRKYRLRSGS